MLEPRANLRIIAEPQRKPGFGRNTEAGRHRPISSANNPPTLDPNATSSAYTHQLLGLSMSRLFQFQTGPDNKVAESWSFSLSSPYLQSLPCHDWTMKLRPDATFHATSHP